MGEQGVDGTVQVPGLQKARFLEGNLVHVVVTGAGGHKSQQQAAQSLGASRGSQSIQHLLLDLFSVFPYLQDVPKDQGALWLIV